MASWSADRPSFRASSISDADPATQQTWCMSSAALEISDLTITRRADLRFDVPELFTLDQGHKDTERGGVHIDISLGRRDALVSGEALNVPE